MKKLRPVALAAALTMLPLSLLPAGPALAQTTMAARPGMPSVSAFDVREVGRLEPGAELDFTLWGTPGGQATLHIDGAQRGLTLVETSPGRYEGTYTVGSRDRIDAQSRVTANLRRGNQVSTAMLAEPLQRGWPSPVAAVTRPEIERVSVSTEGRGRRLRDTLRFTVHGTPGGQASVQIEGSQPTVLALDEVHPGEYTGVYTVPPRGWINTQRDLVARLRVGERSTQSVLARAYDSIALDRPRWSRDFACSDCATVEAVNRIEVDGSGRVIGTVTGGVLGAVVGSQFGKGDGRTAAGVAGAVGGALLGREIERRASRHTAYEVIVRTDDGERRRFTYGDEPALKVGDAVRVVGDTLEARRG